MPGEPVIPYRLPCGATAGKPRYFLGGPFQHGTAPILVDKYVNTTAVPNWDTSDGAPATIGPYERWTQDLSGGGSCEVHHCADGGAPCSAWPPPYPANTFHHTDGDKVDFRVGRKTGFKNVQARRSWHGALPWTAPEAGCITDLCADGTGFQAYQSAASQTKYLTVTYDVHWTYEHQTGEHFSNAADKTGARTVNAQSGEVTSSLTTTETDTFDFGSGLVTTSFTDGGAGYTDPDGDGVHNTDFLVGGTTTLDAMDHDLHCALPIVAPNAPGRGTLFNFIKTWNDGLVDDPSPFTGTSLPTPTDPNSYTGSATGTSNGGQTAWSADLSFSRTATTVNWDFTFIQTDGVSPDPLHINTSHYHGTLTLSNANAASAVYDDITTNLLSLWPLNDDALYPWRSDLKVGIAPLVTRNEVFNVSPIAFNIVKIDDLRSPITDADGNAPFSDSWSPTYDLMNWIDPSIWVFTFADGTQAPVGAGISTATATGLLQLFDGSIIGAPLPAGYQNFFDFAFIDMRGCCFSPPDDPGFHSWSWYQVGWGQDVVTFNSNTGCGLPLNATQWNNWFQAVNKPAGAWLFYADKADYFPSGCPPSTDGAHSGAGDAGAFVAQKWAEIIDLWPSQNFTRPAGDDKFLYDETRVYCATNVSGTGTGSVWALTDPATGMPPTSTIEPDDTWGGPSVGGFYQLSAWDGTNVTLGAKQYDVPSNWKSRSDVGAIDTGSGPKADADLCFGPLRWPDKPSLLGRAAVTPDSDLNCTFTAAQPAFGMKSSTHQEQIDIYQADMTLIAGNVTATRTDDSTFTVDTFYPDAAWVQIHGSPEYYINDDHPKGDCVELEWTSDFRSFGEFGRLTGILDCVGAQVARPTANAGGGPIDSATQFASFKQTSLCLPFAPCAPKVVCISPNGETFPGNGVRFDFPDVFLLDELYGSKWWGFVQPIMTDLLWQPPHRPCNIENCAAWQMDGGACSDNSPGECPPSDGVSAPVYYFAHAPQVEARLTVPENYGADQNESAPALPDGIQIGWSSPVTNTTGDVALPPLPPGVTEEGIPGGANTTWDLHAIICDASAGGCRFGYKLPGC